MRSFGCGFSNRGDSVQKVVGNEEFWLWFFE